MPHKWPAHSRFIAYSFIRTTVRTRYRAGRLGRVFFRGNKVFWPLADQLDIQRICKDRP